MGWLNENLVWLYKEIKLIDYCAYKELGNRKDGMFIMSDTAASKEQAGKVNGKNDETDNAGIILQQ